MATMLAFLDSTKRFHKIIIINHFLKERELPNKTAVTSCENSLDLRDNKLRLLILQSLLIIGSKHGISRQQGYSLILHGEAKSCCFTVSCVP